MKHADEGQLHAYLDGELSPAEVTELERHISVCAPCRALLTEARGFLTESDSLVLALDMPVAAKPYRAPRRIPYSTLAWAAMVILALGTGYALRPALGPKEAANAIRVPQEPSAPIIAAAPAVTPSADAATNTPSTPAPRPERQGARTNAKVSEAPSAALASAGAGAGNEAEGRVSAAEQRVDAVAHDAAPVAQTQPAPAPAAVAQAPSQLTYIDGTPVDTTATRLTFGPRTTAAPKRITLDEAVTHLGGTIRLIDGLAPQRVEILSGVDVVGADPDREVIRVYYEEPDLGLVTLDQQRPGPSFAARDGRAFTRESESDVSPSSVTVNPTARASTSGAAMLRAGVPVNNVTWRADGVWLSLSSKLNGSALAQLRARVK